MTCWIWDATPLHHAGKIDRLDVLGDLAAAGRCRQVTTAAVAQELADRGGAVPAWMEVVHVDGLDEIVALAKWVTLLSSDKHNRSEATVLAWAEVHNAVAIVDDADARRVAQRHGLDVHGTVWVAAQAVSESRWTVSAVSAYLDQLIASGARFPFEPGGFSDWATKARLIAPV